ncbi:sulfotransferase [Svornostia abyssi]|uniref:Sulfotransferase n=1 Tax=Svornostia abyssi TaxID=2898438 RepID=A0ABY5PMY4_9ACTN|nr:sulfotransferase [Parviterribacteraceae bacterium J379]
MDETTGHVVLERHELAAQKAYARRVHDPELLTQARGDARALVAEHPERIARAQAFTAFIGWPRSGHTLVGALLDAHPDAVIAQELDALHLVAQGLTRDELLGLVLLRDQEFGELGRRWMGRDYRVPGGVYDTAAPLVLGDKKGGRSTRLLARDPTLLGRLEETLGLPVRLIHVVRHPVDVITSIARRKPPLDDAIEKFFAAARGNDAILARLPPEHVHVVRFEDVVADPRRHIAALCEYLGLEVREDHLAACRELVLPEPPRERDTVPWSPELHAAVGTRARMHRLLADYPYEHADAVPAPARTTFRARHREAPVLPDDRLSDDDAQRIVDIVHRFAVPVDQPLVLVSQVQRSGGSLLSQLFDGHPELHAHPHELAIGAPTKYDWPRVLLSEDPSRQLDVLREVRHDRLFGEGYAKQMKTHPQAGDELFAFLQPPSLLTALFTRLSRDRPATTHRDILDRYFTAYFNAWLDNANLRTGPKRWVTAFTPRLAWGESRSRFVADYPEGRQISLIRDPHDWYASARGHQTRYADCREAAALWCRNVEEALAAWHERPSQTLVLRFEQLVDDTAGTMSRVADWLGIADLPCLSEPTFNGSAISANSTFRVGGPGIRRETVGRGRDALSGEDAAIIDEVCTGTHERALADPAITQP